MSRSATSWKESDPETLLVYASLRFSGDRLEPQRFTEILDATPKLAYRKGDLYKKIKGHEVRGRTGLWSVSSKDHVTSSDLNDHLEYLLTTILCDHDNNRLAQLQRLMREEGIEADVSCFWHGEPGALSPVIRDDIRARFARLPAVIEEDFDTD